MNFIKTIFIILFTFLSSSAFADQHDLSSNNQTTAQSTEINNENEDAQAARIVLARSVSAGELLTEENLKSVVLPHYNGFGGFFDLTHVLGRKTKTPLREGTVLLSRHLVPNWTIQAEQQVDIENTLSGINVTTVGIALENGHIGDIIKVKNLKSDTIIEGFVINRKKIKINAKVTLM